MEHKYAPEILTVGGEYFQFNDPDNSVYSINDIAHALSHVCRFSGHTKVFYSVAEHCVRASWLVPQEHALSALLHDAAESFIADIATPLKQMLPDYQLIERRVETSIRKRFGVPLELPKEVKHADRVMLAWEKRDLMPNTPQWDCLIGVEDEIPTDVIEPWSSYMAKYKFLYRFKQLTGES